MSVSQWEREWPSQTAWKLQSNQILGWKLKVDSPFLLSVKKKLVWRGSVRESFCFTFPPAAPVSHGIACKNSAWGIYIQFFKANITQALFLGYTFDSCNTKCERTSPNGIQIMFLLFSSVNRISFCFLEQRCSHMLTLCIEQLCKFCSMPAYSVSYVRQISFPEGYKAL